jgi:folate-binding protein YgfZ
MPYFEFSNPIILEVLGRDSTRYLNARLTNNIQALTPGLGCLAAALSPQGKTEGLFSVLCLEEKRYLLFCTGGDRQRILSAFKRYIVADRVEVKDRSDEFGAVHLFAHGEKPLQEILHSLAVRGPLLTAEFSFVATEALIVISSVRASNLGYDLLAPRAALEKLLHVCAAELGPNLTDEEKRRERILANRPEFPSEVREESVFTEAPLRFAVSFTKGCYTGQEVIEKIDSHGKTPRVLSRFSIQAEKRIALGTPVFRSSADGTGIAIGEVVSSAFDTKTGQTLGFFSMKSREAGSSNFEITIEGIPGKIL